jgi:hypothetical protein
LKQLIQFCTECMQEYLHSACHTFFATTTTPHYPKSTQGQQQQTNIKADTRGRGGEGSPVFIHALIY